MPYPLTKLQLAILEVLWGEGESTVVGIHDRLRRDRRVAQSTISTLLGRLKKRGYVEAREDGRQYMYRAAIERDRARRDLAEEFMEHTEPLFGGDVGLLVSHLLRARDIAPGDIDRARELLDELEESDL